MTWELLIPLIARVGLDVAERISGWAAIGAKVTPEQWAELRALGAQTSATQLADAITRSGRDLNSPEAKALLALTGKPQ